MKQLVVTILIFFSLNTFSQVTSKDTSSSERKVLQFSGIVVDGDSLFPIPFSNVIIKNTRRGTACDYFGYFSFVAQEGDTIVFSNISYKEAQFIIPTGMEENRYSLIQILRKDTFSLNEHVVYPWPTREQFKEAFLKMNIPDDDLERARKNLSQEYMATRYEEMPMDANMNFKYYLNQQNSRLYYAGQLPPNNLLNPIAWVKFIEAVKRGDFKKK